MTRVFPLAMAIALPLAAANEARAHNLAPEWSGSVSSIDANNSFLNSSKKPNHSTGVDLRDKFFEEKVRNEMTSYHIARTRSFEELENYDQVTRWDRDAYHTDISNMTVESIMKLVSYHATEGVHKAERTVETVRTFMKVQRTVEHVAKQGAQVQVTERFKFGSRANFPKHRGTVWFNSVVLDGAVDVDWGLPKNDLQLPAVLLVGDERYVIGVGKHLPYLDIASSLSYGGTSSNITAALKKRLTSELSCTVSANNRLDFTDGAQLTGGEEVVKLDYSFAF